MLCLTGTSKPPHDRAGATTFQLKMLKHVSTEMALHV